MTQQTLTEVFKYTDRVIEYVETIHGKKGLQIIADDYNMFAVFCQEYNEQFIKTMDKVLSLEGEKKMAFFSQLATSVFIQVHINEQNKQLAAYDRN